MHKLTLEMRLRFLRFYLFSLCRGKVAFDGDLDQSVSTKKAELE